MKDAHQFAELSSKPVGKLLTQYAVPAIIAMAASSLYNIIDRIFIGQGVGPLAISGLALTLPMMSLTVAFGAMVGVGASTLLSVKLGEKDYGIAKLILGNVIMLNVAMGAVLGILMFWLLDPILVFFGASADTLPYAHDFMKVFLTGNVVTHLYFGLNALLRSVGKPRQAMMSTVATVLINLVLAPLFIYGFRWGIEGAALATVLSQAVVLLWQLRLFSNKNELVHISWGAFRLNKRIVTGSLGIGLSPFLINLCASLVVIVVNQSMVRYGGDLAVGAYGIVNVVGFLFVMLTIGINQGMQPIAGYNYGAKNYGRLIQVVKYACVAATCITTVGFVLGVFFPRLVARAFTTDEALIQTAAEGMIYYSCTFPLIGVQIVSVSFFQSIGQVGKSIFLSLTRQLIFLLPFLIFLPRFFGIKGVWYTIPIADTLSAVLTYIFLYLQIKKLRTEQKNNHE